MNRSASYTREIWNSGLFRWAASWPRSPGTRTWPACRVVAKRRSPRGTICDGRSFALLFQRKVDQLPALAHDIDIALSLIAGLPSAHQVTVPTRLRWSRPRRSVRGSLVPTSLSDLPLAGSALTFPRHFIECIRGIDVNDNLLSSLNGCLVLDEHRPAVIPRATTPVRRARHRNARQLVRIPPDANIASSTVGINHLGEIRKNIMVCLFCP